MYSTALLMHLKNQYDILFIDSHMCRSSYERVGRLNSQKGVALGGRGATWTADRPNGMCHNRGCEMPTSMLLKYKNMCASEVQYSRTRDTQKKLGTKPSDNKLSNCDW